MFWELGLPNEALNVDGVEYYGGVGYLKAGLRLADTITTVSPTYAREIQTPEFGMGLDGLLRTRSAAVHGILNGIDETVWNPSSDPALAQTYTPLRIDMRGRNKAALQKRLGLTLSVDRPLFAVVSRLSHQKGLDLLLHALPRILERSGQVGLLGSGERSLESGFADAAARPPGLGRAASSVMTRSLPICSSPGPTSFWCPRASSLAGLRSSARCATGRRRSSRASADSRTR